MTILTPQPPFSHDRVYPSEDVGLTVQVALRGPDAASQWKAPMEAELDSLHQNSTWTLVPLPPGRKAISCNWILHRKLHSDGTVARHKERLVAQGFSSQVAGLDYTDFLPCAS